MTLPYHIGRLACRGTARRGACLCLAAALLACMGAGAEDAPAAATGRQIRESSGELAARARAPREQAIPLPLLPHGADRQERAAQASIFQIDVLASPLTAEVAGRPGEYPVEPALSLRVTASSPGWSIRIKALDLQHDDPPHGDKISADEVCRVKEDGVLEPLRAPATLVAAGGAGEGVVEARLALLTRDFHTPGEYAGWVEVITSNAHGPSPRTIKVPIAVTVRARASHVIRDNKVYFHFAQLPAAQDATVKGEISSDVPVNLSISTQSERLDRLPLVKAFGGDLAGEGGAAGSIELDWQLAEGALGAARPPDQRTSDSRSFTWLLAGTPGELAYRLLVGAKPAAHQAPGDYGMEVVVTLQPRL